MVESQALEQPVGRQGRQTIPLLAPTGGHALPTDSFVSKGTRAVPIDAARCDTKAVGLRVLAQQSPALLPCSGSHICARCRSVRAEERRGGKEGGRLWKT